MMAGYKKKSNFLDTEAAIKVMEELRNMQLNSAYSTEASYSANSTLYPDNMIPFIDKHMNYLNAHQNVNPDHYMANLRLLSKLKVSSR